MASRMATTSPARTTSPTETRTSRITPGSGEVTCPPPEGTGADAAGAAGGAAGAGTGAGAAGTAGAAGAGAPAAWAANSSTSTSYVRPSMVTRNLRTVIGRS